MGLIGEGAGAGWLCLTEMASCLNMSRMILVDKVRDSAPMALLLVVPSIPVSTMSSEIARLIANLDPILVIPTSFKWSVVIYGRRDPSML